jgi:hypothetical protein
VTKSGREIMEIFEAFDLTGTAWSAAQLAGCDAKTVARYVGVRRGLGSSWSPARMGGASRSVAGTSGSGKVQAARGHGLGCG